MDLWKEGETGSWGGGRRQRVEVGQDGGFEISRQKKLEKHDRWRVRSYE